MCVCVYVCVIWPVQSTAGLPISALQIGTSSQLLRSRSGFKSETSFGFLGPNYMGRVTWFFCKTSKRSLLVSFRVLSKRYFERAFGHSIDNWAQNRFLLSQNNCMRVTCVNLVVCPYIEILDNVSRNFCFVLCSYHLYAQAFDYWAHAHQLDFLK